MHALSPAKMWATCWDYVFSDTIIISAGMEAEETWQVSKPSLFSPDQSCQEQSFKESF